MPILHELALTERFARVRLPLATIWIVNKQMLEAHAAS